MLLDHCKGSKIVIFVAVFHGVHSDYTILWIFAERKKKKNMVPEVEWLKLLGLTFDI